MKRSKMPVYRPCVSGWHKNTMETRKAATRANRRRIAGHKKEGYQYPSILECVIRCLSSRMADRMAVMVPL